MQNIISTTANIMYKTLCLIFVLLNVYDYLYIRVDIIFLSLRIFKQKSLII